MNFEALIIGTSSAGKTVLVRQLRHISTQLSKKKKKKGQNNNNDPTLFDTKPTVGVELDHLVVDKKINITLREVGSPMAPMWSAFHKGCSAVVFLLDSSDHAMLPEAAVELWNSLGSKELSNKPFLVVASKADVPSLLSRDMILRYLKLDDARKVHGSSVDVMFQNLTNHDACMEVLQWLKDVAAKV